MLSAVIDQWVDDVRAVPDDVSALLPLDDLNAELQVIARGTMRVLDRQRPLFLALAKDPASMPGLVERIQADLVDVGYKQMTAWFQSQLRRRGADTKLARAFASVALSSLAHFHQDDALYGTPPGATSRVEFVNAWVIAWRSTLDAMQTK